MGNNEHIQNTTHVLEQDGHVVDLYGNPFTRQYAGIQRLPPGPATLVELLIHAAVDFRITRQTEAGIAVEQPDSGEKMERVKIARQLRAVQMGRPATLTRAQIAFLDARCDAAFTAELYVVIHEAITSLPVAPEDGDKPENETADDTGQAAAE